MSGNVQQDPESTPQPVGRESQALKLGDARQPLDGAPVPEETARAARRLHDGFIRTLLAISMGLRTARSLVGDPEAASLYMGAAAAEIDRVAGQLRSYALVLGSGLIRGSELERDLRSLARQLEDGRNVSMAVDIDALAASTLAARSRSEDVVQTAREAVDNALHQSASKKLGLTLFLVNGAAVLEIRTEDGRLDRDQLIRRGSDVSSLHAHAQALNGVLEVESQRGQGTRVRVRIPLSDEAEGAPIGTEGGRGIRVVVVDAHELVREGVRAVTGIAGDIMVCGEASSADEALRVAEWANPDVVLMDVRLADGSGIEAARALRARHPATRVLMLASFGDDEALFSSIRAGAAGFVLKDIKGHHLLDAIRSVAAGRNLLDPAVTGSVFERLRQAGTPVPDEKLSRLSPQEERILALVAEGKSNREIAHALHLAEKTVKNYMSGILSKLEVTRRVEAATWFTRRS
jgi:two-component system response regulator DevR